MTMKISLGPVQYYWDRNTLLEFYARAVETPVDIIYLGETVCSKRRALAAADWLELAAQIRSTGKEVVLSTLTLMEAESELSQTRTLLEKFDGMIEANDYAAVGIAHRLGKPVCAGATLNIYNPATLRRMMDFGVARWVPPLELSGTSLQQLLQQARLSPETDGLQTEVFSYGRLPLAHSARCYTARYANLPKDQCQFRCQEYPEGIPVFSQEHQGLFQLNGIQTQSFARCNLIPHWQGLQQAGVSIMRISVSTPDCLREVSVLRDAIDGTGSRVASCDADDCNGYWFGSAGMTQVDR